MYKKDLQKTLNNVIEKYGKNEGYPVPEIVWSECNYYSSFGEYQYWRNRIVINIALNDENVSTEALESVVYHEYTHQEIAEHNNEFNARMNKIPNYNELQKELNMFLDTAEILPAKIINDLPLSANKDTLVVNLYYDGDDAGSYESFIGDFDRFYIGSFEKELPKKYNNNIFSQVIFTFENNGMLFVAGWAKNVKVYACDQKVNLSRYLDVDTFVYQFKCKITDARWLMRLSSFTIEEYSLMPASFKRSKVCMLSDFSNDVAAEIIEEINAYDGEFLSCGIKEDALECKSSILSTDSNFIRALAEKDVLFRALWLINKALELDANFENYKFRAETHEAITNLECSISDYQKCVEIAKKQNKPIEDLEDKIKKLRKAHQIFNEDFVAF